MAPNTIALPEFSLRAGVCALVMGVSLPTLAWAENGAIAYARPASGITIDGDLSDWPANAERFTVNLHLAGADWDDASAFQVAWDPTGEALYVALTWDDESTVLGEEGPDDWLGQDTHIVYVDATHHPRGTSSWTLAASLEGAESVTDPDTWDPQAARARDEAITVAHGEHNGVRIVEWRVELDQPVRAGMTIGLDHLLVDNDEDQPPSYATWGPYGAKAGRAGRLGDLVLLGEDDALGTLTGLLAWPRGVEGPGYDGLRARITKADDPRLWLNAVSDETGRYSVELPPGRYCAEPAFRVLGSQAEFRIDDDARVCATVEAGGETEAPDLIWYLQTRPEHLIAESGVLFDFDASAARRLDQFMTAHLHHFTIPGASVVIIQDGEIAYRQDYGVSNWLTQQPLRPDDLYDAGSITKPIFAFAVHRLVEQGVLELDRPLHEYLPFEDIAHDERSLLFTARHVLSHQTGLPNWRWQTDSGELDIAFTPGEGYRYSGEGYDYLGRVIEHLTGEELEDVLMREAVAPLGMSEDVRFSQRGDWHDRFVFGHSELRALRSGAPDEAHAAYSMHASADDLAQVLLTWMNRGGGLSPEGYETMFEVQVDAEFTAANTNWPNLHAVGPRVLETPYGRALGHGGVNFGQITLMEYYEDHDDGFVVMTNGGNGWHVRDALRRFLVAGREHSTFETE